MQNTTQEILPPMQEKVMETERQISLPEVLSQGSGVGAMIAATEINQQIATARAYPRSVEVALQRIRSLATLDEAAAKESIYAVPRDGKAIEGPSIRFAEIAYQSWGNCRVSGVVTHVDEEEGVVIAEGTFIDLETNAAMKTGVRRNIRKRNGGLFSQDMITTTGNAAIAIAKRNAILAGIPKGVWRVGLDAARKVVMGDLKTLAQRRDDILKEFQRFGATAENVFQLIGVKGKEDISLEHMPALVGFHNALKEGEKSIDELLGKRNTEKPNSNPLASAAKPAAAKEESGAQAPVGEGNTDGQDTTEKSEGSGSDQPSTGTATGEELSSPSPKPPKNAAEYALYAGTIIKDAKDGKVLGDWWKSPEEAALRKSCKFTNDQSQAMKQTVLQRIDSLQQGEAQ